MAADPIPAEVWLPLCRLIRQKTRRLDRATRAAGLEADDLIQEASIAAWVAWPRRAAGAPRSQLVAWLYRRAVGAMLDVLRGGGAYSRGHLRAMYEGAAGMIVPLGAPMECRGAGAGRAFVVKLIDTLADSRSPDPTAIDTPEELFRAAARRAGLPSSGREYRMLWDYYGRGLTMRESGAACGVSESRVSQIHEREIARAREAMGV